MDLNTISTKNLVDELTTRSHVGTVTYTKDSIVDLDGGVTAQIKRGTVILIIDTEKFK